jgi:hypothetical protein
MKRYIYLPIIALLLAALACATPTTPTGTPPAPTGTLTPTGTENPVETPTQEPSATPTPEPGANLFVNPGFEGTYDFDEIADRNGGTVKFPQVIVPPDWHAWYCDFPYTAGPCPAERRGNGNPTDLVMGRPEYRPIYKRDPHGGETAAQWFCYDRTCRAGLSQTIDTEPGHTYRALAWVQSWSNYDDDPESELGSQDDQDNSQWRVVVAPESIHQIYNDNGTLVLGAEAGPVLAGTAHYDNWALLSYDFIAKSSRTTVYFENLRLWPIPNNDNYLDDASAVCLDCNQVFPTPTPIQTPPTPEATPIGEEAVDPRQGTLVFTASTNIRECEVDRWDEDVLRYFLTIDPVSACAVVDGFEPGNAARNWQFVNTSDDSTWAWLYTTPVEGDHSLAGVAAVCWRGTSRARYYPGFTGGLDELPTTWVDPCGISGGAQDVIASQGLVSEGELQMFDWNNLVALLSQFALIAVALIVLALGNERIIELVQWVLGWFGAEVDGEKLKTVFSALVGLIMAAVAGLGLDGPLQELLGSLTPGFADMVNWIAAFIALLSGMGLIEWFTNMWHDLFKASRLTTSTRGRKASAARP